MNSNLSCHSETLKSEPDQQFFGPCDLETWQMTSENNRASLLCHFKLSALFCSHLWNQTGVTVWKHSIWVKFTNFSARVTLKLDGWHWKTIGHLSYATSSFEHHFVAICVMWVSLETPIGTKSVLTLTFDLDITFVNGDNFWNFHDDTMTGTLWKRSDRWMDGQNRS